MAKVEQLLTTKLYIPPTRPELVPRPRLIEQLNEGLHRKLTLISAPAGFGKTTLVSEWLGNMRKGDQWESQSVFSAWLSLDEGDNDPTRFLTYFIAALNQGIEGTIGEGALRMLQSPQLPPTDAVLTSLINEITAIPGKIILVLDDYHIIESSKIDDALTFLLKHQPPKMHLVIATREDPDLPLTRLRARGELTELRAKDLRFSTAEAADFLNQVMGLDLSAEDIAALETRTEGWITGLQLTAISMQGHKDVTSFIESFTGSHRYLLDYLIEEVLEQQTENVQTFLLQTAILDQLAGSLCDALTGQDSGQQTLEYLEGANLFIIPLDNNRQWYRYHHLFADVLQVCSMEEQPNQVASLHRRASEWYEQNNSPSDAIRHALAAEDFERAAGLIELAWPAMDWSFQSDTWLGWVKALPDELVRARPVLSVGYAWALLNDGELEAGEARLRDAEGWLVTSADMAEQSATPSGEMVFVDEEQFRSLPATIASARTYYAQALGDVTGSVKYARQALDLLPEAAHPERGRLAVLLGLAYWASGDLETGHQSFVDAMASFQKAGNILYAISFTFILADIRIAQGRLHEAISTYEQSLHLAREQGDPVLQGTANLYLGLSELNREQGDLDSAERNLLNSEQIGDQSEVYQYRLCRAKARLKAAQGNLDGALDLLDQADRWLYYENPIPDVRPTAALKTRVWIAQGKLTETLGWARERDLSVDDDLSYLREFEHATLARLLIAQEKNSLVEGSIHKALGLLERLLAAAEEGGRMGSVIELLVPQALAHAEQGNSSSALVSLERALTLAEPEGYVRIFVDEGRSMALLLNEALNRGIKPEYVRQLLVAFPDFEPEPADSVQGQAPGSELVEPLSEREIEVLQLIAAGHKYQEVAEQLVISLNTVRHHTKNIYCKLEVNNRTQAIKKANDLNLLQH
ncbi:LuxR C-terminal-related transcriptional regulator [Chloroflexota bacterium]